MKKSAKIILKSSLKSNIKKKYIYIYMNMWDMWLGVCRGECMS